MPAGSGTASKAAANVATICRRSFRSNDPRGKVAGEPERVAAQLNKLRDEVRHLRPFTLEPCPHSLVQPHTQSGGLSSPSSQGA
jgi:hypothetical protein